MIYFYFKHYSVIVDDLRQIFKIRIGVWYRLRTLFPHLNLSPEFQSWIALHSLRLKLIHTKCSIRVDKQGLLLIWQIDKLNDVVIVFIMVDRNRWPGIHGCQWWQKRRFLFDGHDQCWGRNVWGKWLYTFPNQNTNSAQICGNWGSQTSTETWTLLDTCVRHFGP